MRKLSYALAASLLVFGLAGQAHAVSLASPAASQSRSPRWTPVVLPGAGTAIVNGSGAGGHLTGLALAGGRVRDTGFVLPVTDPAAFPIAGIQVTAPTARAPSRALAAAGLGGQMPIHGASKVCLFGACSMAVAEPERAASVVGDGGAAIVTGAVNLTVVGAPWTTGTAAVGTIAIAGGVDPALEHRRSRRARCDS